MVARHRWSVVVVGGGLTCLARAAGDKTTATCGAWESPWSNCCWVVFPIVGMRGLGAQGSGWTILWNSSTGLPCLFCLSLLSLPPSLSLSLSLSPTLSLSLSLSLSCGRFLTFLQCADKHVRVRMHMHVHACVCGSDVESASRNEQGSRRGCAAIAGRQVHSRGVRVCWAGVYVHHCMHVHRCMHVRRCMYVHHLPVAYAAYPQSNAVLTHPLWRPAPGLDCPGAHLRLAFPDRVHAAPLSVSVEAGGGETKCMYTGPASFYSTLTSCRYCVCVCVCARASMCMCSCVRERESILGCMCLGLRSRKSVTRTRISVTLSLFPGLCVSLCV